MGDFLPFDCTNNLQNQNFEKMKKNPSRYNHFTNVYHKWQSHDVWFSRYGVQQTEFFPRPPNNPIWFWKNVKNPRDIIILHKYTKKHDHKLLCSWDKAHDRCNFFYYYYFSFGGYFLKKWKKTPQDNIILHMCTKNYHHMMYSFWDMVCKEWTETYGKKDMERWVPHLKMLYLCRIDVSQGIDVNKNQKIVILATVSISEIKALCVNQMSAMDVMIVSNGCHDLSSPNKLAIVL